MVKPFTFSLKPPPGDSLEVRYGKLVLRNVSKSVLPPGTVITAEDGTLYVGHADGSLRRHTPKLSKKERQQQRRPKRVSSPRRATMKVLRHKDREQPEDGQIAGILDQLGRISRGEHNDSNLALKTLADSVISIIPYELVDEAVPEPKTDDTPPTGESDDERAAREQREVEQANEARARDAERAEGVKDGFVIDPDDEEDEPAKAGSTKTAPKKK